MKLSNETTPTFTTPRSVKNLRNRTSGSDVIISYQEISRFVQHQTSQEATYVRGSLDFSGGQILHDPTDRRIGSNSTSNGVVSIKPHGSSYLSRISKKNFTDQGNQGYIAVEDQKRCQIPTLRH